jgi:hypothetical protein
MGFVRPRFSVVVLGAVLFAARPALSGPSLTDHLVSGTVLPQDALLTAGAEGAVYELRGGAILNVSAGTAFAFEPSIRLKLRKPGDPDTFARSVRLTHGHVDVTIPAKYREQTAVFLHGSGKLGAVAKEGISTFIADDVRTTVASREGEMLVGIGNEWKPLKEGFARTVEPSDAIGIPRPILGAPQAKTDHDLVVVEGERTAHFSATWSALKEATTYDVAFTPFFGPKEQRRSTVHESTSATTATWKDLVPGSYAVKVAAVDRSGLAGAPSSEAILRVVGLSAPDGATIADDGTVALGHDQRVSLTDGTGLEVSYGSSSVFQPAPSTLGLAHNGPTLVRLRKAGSKEETVVQLEPKGLRANVTIGPRVARWPLDRVVIDVELYDTNGRPVPDGADISPTITVNLDPVSVKWVRSGRTLHAELSPGMAPGPWVVRAEVHDRRGELLGRDFLEVARVEPRGTETASR